jgi:hypothetical protein
MELQFIASVPVAGTECSHCRRLHFADAKEQVKLGKGKFIQGQSKNSLGVLWQKKIVKNWHKNTNRHT